MNTQNKFRYVDDIEDWLEPMDYQGFWVAVAPYDLIIQPRDHCDQQIASGVVDEATVLYCIKHMAVQELAQKWGLEDKPVAPWLQLVK